MMQTSLLRLLWTLTLRLFLWTPSVLAVPSFGLVAHGLFWALLELHLLHNCNWGRGMASPPFILIA